MKTFILATAATLALATAATAADFTVAGQTLSLGGEVDMNYTTGEDVWAMDFTPGVGVTAYGVDFSVETNIDVLALNDGDLFEGLDFEAGYTLPNTGIRAYGEISTDEDLEFGDLKAGLVFAF